MRSLMESTSAPDWSKVLLKSIRDDQDFVALSSKQQNRLKVGRRKILASVRRPLKSKTSKRNDEKTENKEKGDRNRRKKQEQEKEKDRMVNMLMVKTVAPGLEAPFFLVFPQYILGYCEKEISKQYNSFVKMCPEGCLSKSLFLEVSRGLYGQKAANLSEGIFDIFDEDQSGHIDFVEYMMAINSSNMHTAESKLTWIFNVFDKDASGTIDSEELDVMLQGLFTMAGLEWDSEDVSSCRQEILTVCDEDGDRSITKREFIKHAIKSVFIRSIL